VIKAVLLDLDNTLLTNPDAAFASAYLRLADEYFLARWRIAGMSRILLEVSRALAGPRNGYRTNTELAMDIISSAVQKPLDEITATFDDFYQTVYPRLKDVTQPIGDVALRIIETLRERQMALVIATNPLYPPEAVRQRLLWAGLPADFQHYTLVTHAGNMHFAKPDPSYYIEALARVGVEPDETIMVGDSLQNDIQPARQAGLHTVHVQNRDDLEQFYRDFVLPPDRFAHISTHPPALSMIVPELRGTMGALFGVMADAHADYWLQHPYPDEWSPMQILCHLFESERQVQRPRLERILAEENPFLISPPPPTGAREPLPCDVDGWQVAHRFVCEREKTIAWVVSRKPEDWKRPARHSIFGHTTLLEMAHFTAQHDRLHINQLCQTLGRCR